MSVIVCVRVCLCLCYGKGKGGEARPGAAAAAGAAGGAGAPSSCMAEAVGGGADAGQTDGDRAGAPAAASTSRGAANTSAGAAAGSSAGAVARADALALVCARGCGRTFKMVVWQTRHEAQCTKPMSSAAARAPASAKCAVPPAAVAEASFVTARTACKFACGKTYARLDFRLAHEEICDGSPPVTSHAKGAGQGIRESLEAARSALFFAEPRTCSVGCGRFYRMAAYL